MDAKQLFSILLAFFATKNPTSYRYLLLILSATFPARKLSGQRGFFLFFLHRFTRNLQTSRQKFANLRRTPKSIRNKIMNQTSCNIAFLPFLTSKTRFLCYHAHICSISVKRTKKLGDWNFEWIKEYFQCQRGSIWPLCTVFLKRRARSYILHGSIQLSGI